MSDLLHGLRGGLAPLPLAGLGVALASLLLLLVGGPQAMTGWLIAATFWVGVPVGALGWVMIHHLTGGKWGETMRPAMEAASVTLPVAAALMLPPLIACGWAFPWGNAAMIAASETLRHQQAWMWPPFVWLRGLIYVGYGTALALTFWRARRPMVALAAPGLIGIFILGSFAALDFWMTRTVGYVSTIFGFLVLVGWAYSAWAVGVLARVGEGPAEVRDEGKGADGAQGGEEDDEEFEAGKEEGDRWNHIGSLLGTISLLWGYLEFMNFLIAWMGNKLPESPWFVLRGFGGVMPNGWRWAALGLFFLSFAGPFGAMLFRSIKRFPPRLATIAGVAVAGRVLDAAWLAGPSDMASGFGWWSVLAAAMVIGGFGAFWWPVWAALRAATPAVVTRSDEQKVAKHVAASS